MTIEQALYVLDHHDQYDEATYIYARDIVESARRQGILR